jgi:hypothetical protein
MLMTQSSAGGEGGAINKDAIVNTSVNDIMAKLQKPYEEDKTLDEIDTNCGCDPKDPKVYFTNVVIKQEIQYVNKLIKKIRSHLKDISDVIKGFISMSTDLEVI